MVLPVVKVIGALGTVSKDFAKWQEYLDEPYITCWEQHLFSEK